MTVASHADDSGTPAGLNITAGAHSRTQDRRRAQMLDRCAGDAYRAGQSQPGAAPAGPGPCRRPIPSAPARRAPGPRVSRQAGRRAPGQPLAELVASRLAEAGVAPDDPALRRIAEHNAQAQARAGVAPTAAAPASEPERERFRQQVLAAAAQMEAGS